MNNTIKKEFNDLMFSGRTMSESEFERKSDEFIALRTKKEKEILSEYLTAYFSNKLKQYQEVTSEISMLEQLEGIEEYINTALKIA